jgi:hypothetical protein
MFQTEVDKAQNLFTVRYTGRITSAEAKRAAEEVETVLQGLQPGFRLLTDMSGLESMALESVPHLERMMDVCNDKGVGLVVRIIPDPHKDIGMNIMSLFHYRRGVRIITCATAEEAQEALKN